jgi:hypothetical protein
MERRVNGFWRPGSKTWQENYESGIKNLGLPYGQAMSLLMRADEGATAATPEERAMVKTAVAEAFVLVGGYYRAKQYLIAAIELLGTLQRPTRSHRAWADITWRLGLVQWEMGDFEESDKSLQQAWQMMELQEGFSARQTQIDWALYLASQAILNQNLGVAEAWVANASTLAQHYGTRQQRQAVDAQMKTLKEAKKAKRRLRSV